MYSDQQERDEHGRFASNGGPSQAKAERVKLNQQLDARNRSRTFGFGPHARKMESASHGGGGSGGGGSGGNVPAHMQGIHAATKDKTLGMTLAPSERSRDDARRTGGGQRFAKRSIRKLAEELTPMSKEIELDRHAREKEIRDGLFAEYAAIKKDFNDIWASVGDRRRVRMKITLAKQALKQINKWATAETKFWEEFIRDREGE
jgi:hypothetical protein